MTSNRNWRMIAALLWALPCWMGAQELLPGTGEDAGKTVIYRDTWGIPHIYAPTAEAGLYAMGWAQAEDRPAALLENLARALGESARFEGPDGLRQDQVIQLFDLYGTVQANASDMGPEMWGHVQAYAQGVNDFYAAHPGDRPEWWGERPVDEFMVVAFARLFLYNWSIDEAFEDLQRGGIEPGYDLPQRGSNQWSVSPARSANGAAILYIDPHLSWWGPSRFWEFRIHAGGLHGSGVTLAGFPYVGLGHNADLAWAMTTGGPDTADVYELTLNGEDPEKYLYDGEWRDFTKREVIIPVKGGEPKTLTLYASHHGPIIALRNKKAYAAAMAYTDQVRVLEAWNLFNFATDYTGAVAAMDTLQLFPQNVMVADTSGNIYYQRTGRVPRRAHGYDWSRPVNGSTSATAWQGFHPASDHVQVLNPPQGYMQNCNIPPDVMMVESPFSPSKYPPYIYGTPGGYSNPRGARAVQLLHQDDSVTIEEALAYAVDVHVFGAERWVEALRLADQAAGAQFQDHDLYKQGLADLLAWDCELRRDSSAALKYYYWRKTVQETLGKRVASVGRILDGAFLSGVGVPDNPINLSPESLEALARAFDEAMAFLAGDCGRLDAAYGDKFRVGRDGVSWPVGGGGDYGTTTLRNVKYEGDQEDGTRWGRAGQTSTQICVMTKPVQSWSYLPVGESDRPESPHYRDQAEKAFSPRQLKSTWWMPEQLKDHIESRTVLENAP